MLRQCRAFVAILTLLALTAFAARADDLQSAMEEANAKFLEAFNRPNPSGFLGLYTPDSILLFQGVPPKSGPEAIMQFWESGIEAGARDHTFEIINAWADGKYAYQIAKAGIQLVPQAGEKTAISGYSVRIFEKQGDGTWKAKVHMFNRRGGP
jgi:ketosteroid isomerase-like protein